MSIEFDHTPQSRYNPNPLEVAYLFLWDTAQLECHEVYSYVYSMHVHIKLMTFTNHIHGYSALGSATGRLVKTS